MNLNITHPYSPGSCNRWRKTKTANEELSFTSRYVILKFQSWSFSSLLNGYESCLGTNRQEREQDRLTSCAVGIRDSGSLPPESKWSLQHLPLGADRNPSHQFPKNKHGEIKKKKKKEWLSLISHNYHLQNFNDDICT